MGLVRHPETGPGAACCGGFPAAGSCLMFIDADTWFFGDPTPVFEEIGPASVALSPHRFHAASRDWPSMASTTPAASTGGMTTRVRAASMRGATSAWSGAPSSRSRMDASPDQGYLNLWPERYSGVHILKHPGVNLAPWNIDGHLLQRQGQIGHGGWPAAGLLSLPSAAMPKGNGTASSRI